jgi:hypothetical protein
MKIKRCRLAPWHRHAVVAADGRRLPARCGPIGMGKFCQPGRVVCLRQRVQAERLLVPASRQRPRVKMTSSAQRPDHHQGGDQAGRGPAAISFLKRAGRKALDVAIDIGGESCG